MNLKSSENEKLCTPDILEGFKVTTINDKNQINAIFQPGEIHFKIRIINNRKI